MLTTKFDEALTYAHNLHREQRRKNHPVPYFAHLMAVCGLVLEDGGSETEAIAALLHDGPEDQGGETTLVEIREKFGAEVAEIVAACSDTFESPKPPWKARKEAHLAHLREASPSVLRVMNADKLHNLRTIVRDMRVAGAAYLDNFNGGHEGTLWYYHEVLTIFKNRREGYLVEEMERAVAQMEALANPINP